MPTVGEREAMTQRRVVEHFLNVLKYRYLGHWQDRPNNANVEPDVLREWLTRRGTDARHVDRAIALLDAARRVGGTRTLYEANREVYGLLRYGVKFKPDVGAQTVTVPLVDWSNPAANDFAIAEEVTLVEQNEKRPDVVLYVNGIALGVLELKRSTVSVGEGIRQNLDNQKREFVRGFFATAQLVMAGNEVEGLRYGTIETPEKHYLRWREDAAAGDAAVDAESNPLLRELGQVCRKDRLLELVHDFVAFDAGVKKLCRHNQYFGVRAAHDYVRRRAHGVLWHTQGSGKSLTMVWLARWVREHLPDARVLLVTDRTELDQQIEGVFGGVGESIYRTSGGADLIDALGRNDRPLVCSLVHKFGRAGGSEDDELSDRDVDAYVESLRRGLPAGWTPKGELFVFVDECHRSQSGKLHRAMKALMPAATFVGFTGTPLLKRDKATSVETFGPYIHTYKYDAAVTDGVVLDLRYEARDIDQEITSPEKIDEWFEAKTRGLGKAGKALLKARWGTMRKVLSSQGRLERIAADIEIDMATRPRLADGRGNAMLVGDSIYAACRLYELFERGELKGRCAIVTSYAPTPSDIKGEEAGAGLTERLTRYDVYRRMLADHFEEPADVAMHKVEEFERRVKERFIKEPGQMRLLIVVNKLLTGFDAPPATYLYIDKVMQDHGLFQAICRVNRLDGDDKEYGYIVDYKDLFKSLRGAIQDYTGGAFENFDAADVEGLLQDRLKKGRERLDEAREEVRTLCEPVEPPAGTAQFIRYFCGDTANPAALADTEPQRAALYKLAGGLVRAFAAIANELADAGYTPDEVRAVREDVDRFAKASDEVKLASGDHVDLKRFEPAMRQLLDLYVRAGDSRVVSTLDDLSLIDLLADQGEAGVDALPEGIRGDERAVAETIENNVRRTIADAAATNPKFYERMSELLGALVLERKASALEYRVYLRKVVDLVRELKRGTATASYPAALATRSLQALYDNTGQNEPRALAVDAAVRASREADWRGDALKERKLLRAIRRAMDGADDDAAQRVLELVRNQHDY